MNAPTDFHHRTRGPRIVLLLLLACSLPHAAAQQYRLLLDPNPTTSGDRDANARSFIGEPGQVFFVGSADPNTYEEQVFRWDATQGFTGLTNEPQANLELYGQTRNHLICGKSLTQDTLFALPKNGGSLAALTVVDSPIPNGDFYQIGQQVLYIDDPYYLLTDGTVAGTVTQQFLDANALLFAQDRDKMRFFRLVRYLEPQSRFVLEELNSLTFQFEERVVLPWTTASQYDLAMAPLGQKFAIWGYIDGSYKVWFADMDGGPARLVWQSSTPLNYGTTGPSTFTALLSGGFPPRDLLFIDGSQEMATTFPWDNSYSPYSFSKWLMLENHLILSGSANNPYVLGVDPSTGTAQLLHLWESAQRNGMIDLGGTAYFFDGPQNFYSTDGTPAGTLLREETTFQGLPVEWDIIENQVWGSPKTPDQGREPWFFNGTTWQQAGNLNRCTTENTNYHPALFADMLTFRDGNQTYMVQPGAGNGPLFALPQGFSGIIGRSPDGVWLRAFNGISSSLILHATYPEGILTAPLETSFFHVNDGRLFYAQAGNLFVTDKGPDEATLLISGLPSDQLIGEAYEDVLFKGHLWFFPTDISAAPIARLDLDQGTWTETQLFTSLFPKLTAAGWQLEGEHHLWIRQGTRIYVSDLTSEGTLYLNDLFPQETPIFTADTPEALFFQLSEELWRTDGTAANTVRVLDFHDWIVEFTPLMDLSLGFISSGFTLWSIQLEPGLALPMGEIPRITGLLAHQDRVFFSGYTTGNGQELMESDGTLSGTRVLEQLIPGPSPSLLDESLRKQAAELYFTGQNGSDGRAIWSYCVTPSPEINVPAGLCSGQTGTATVAFQGIDAQHNWSMTGATLLSGQGTNRIEFQADGTNPIRLELDVTMPGGCTGRGEKEISIVDGPPPALGSIDGPTEICSPHTVFRYRVNPIEGASGYLWTVPSGAFIVWGQGSHEIALQFLGHGGTLSVAAENGCGLGISSDLAITILGEAANAGPDQQPCSSETYLDANLPAGTNGGWQIIAGIGGVLDDPTDPQTRFSGLLYENYMLRWTLEGNACTPAADDVLIRFLPPLDPADAGPDLVQCSSSGNFEAKLPHDAQGLWTVLSSPEDSQVSIADPSKARSSFSLDRYGTYRFRWTLRRGSCMVAYDEMSVFYPQERSLYQAGPDLITPAGVPVTLQGNKPPGDAPTLWTIQRGPSLDLAQLSDPGDINATFTPLGGAGTYELRLEFPNPSCSELDRMLVFVVDDGQPIPLVKDGYEQISLDGEAAALGSKLLFVSQQEDFGAELWVSDGTPAGTLMIRDLNPFPSGSGTLPTQSSDPSHFQAFNGQLFFFATGPLGRTLYHTDGTDAGTKVASVIDPTVDQFPEFLLQAGGRLFFPGQTWFGGKELWSSDGTDAGTQLFSEITPGSASSAFGPALVDGDSDLIFTVQTAAGDRLFLVSNGSQSADEISLDHPNLTGQSFTIERIQAVDHWLYLQIQAGSRQFFKLNRNTNQLSIWGAFAGYEDLLAATAAIPGTGLYFLESGYLRRTSIQSGETAFADNSTRTNGLLQADQIFSSKLYFTENGYPQQLFRADLDLAPVTPFSTALYARLFTQKGGLLFFVAEDANLGFSLMETDGNQVWPTAWTTNSWTSQHPEQIIPAGNLLFFHQPGNYNTKNLLLVYNPANRTQLQMAIPATVCLGAGAFPVELFGQGEAPVTWSVENGTLLADEGNRIWVQAQGPGPINIRAESGGEFLQRATLAIAKDWSRWQDKAVRGSGLNILDLLSQNSICTLTGE